MKCGALIGLGKDVFGDLERLDWWGKAGYDCLFNSLTAMVADLRPLFFDLRKKIISPPIFVPSARQG